mgnify:CR=1 FL=1
MLFSNRDLKKLIIPLIIEQVLALTIGIFDTMMVSQCGQSAVSGVSIVDGLNVLIINIFSALATGGAVVCSQYIGKKDEKMACHSAKQLLFTILGLSLVIMVLCMVFNGNLLNLIFGHIESDVMAYARTYFFFWRKNLKQNILLWLPVMILFIFCLINLYILPFMPETFFRSLTLCIQFLILLLLQGFLIYAFFLPDQYRTTLKYTVKNAVILTFKYLPATFLCICINALPVSIPILLPKITGYVLAAFIIIGFSGISFLHTFILQLLLKKENLFGSL